MFSNFKKWVQSAVDLIEDTSDSNLNEKNYTKNIYSSSNYNLNQNNKINSNHLVLNPPIILIDSSNNSNENIFKIQNKSKSSLELSLTDKQFSTCSETIVQHLNKTVEHKSAPNGNHFENDLNFQTDKNKLGANFTPYTTPNSLMTPDCEIKQYDDSNVDLSNLSNEEKAQIESVLKRAQAEEDIFIQKKK